MIVPPSQNMININEVICPFSFVFNVKVKARIKFNNKRIEYEVFNGITLEDGDYYYSEYPSIIIRQNFKNIRISQIFL